MPAIKLTSKEKDCLIKILKNSNAEKDQAINRLTSDLVFAHYKISKRDEMIQQIKEMIC